MPAPNTKQNRIADDIRQRIANCELSSGDVIPSYRELVGQYGVAISTVRQAISALEAEGLIKPVVGKGCIVTEKSSEPQTMLVAVFGNYDPRSAVYSMDRIEAQLAERCVELAFKFYRNLDRVDIQALISLAGSLDGLILLGGAPLKVLTALREQNQRFVMAGMPLDGPCPSGISQVTVDVEAIVRASVGHLSALGHRRLVLIRSHGSRYTKELSRAFHNTAEECGLNDMVREVIWTSQASDTEPSVLASLAGGSERPTALLVDSMVRATRILRDLRHAGLDVPGEMSLLAISEGPIPQTAHDFISRVEVSIETLLLRSVQILQTVDRSIHVEHLSPRFISGDSCRPYLPTFTVETPNA